MNLTIEYDLVSVKLNQHTKYLRLIDCVMVLRPTRHKIGHFGDVLPRQTHAHNQVIALPGRHVHHLFLMAAGVADNKLHYMLLH